VKSLERTRITKGGGITKVKERILKQHIDRFGYCKVCLLKDGVHYFRKAHRLVAIAFIPNLENKPEINHKDGAKTNNCVSNLEWNTPSENKRHAYVNGLNGGSHITHRRRVVQYDKDHNLVATYLSIENASKKTGTRHSSIWMCCNGRYKTAGGYIWEYAQEGGSENEIC
jgi:hypothetical protein